LNQEELFMSRPFSNPSRQTSSDINRLSETITAFSSVAQQTSVPSLESLLASCGALHSALRHDSDADPSDEIKYGVDQRDQHDAGCTVGTECLRSANEWNEAEKAQAELSLQEPVHSAAASDALPADVASLMKLLRNEFRTSIDELKSAQSEAAASQGALLKTLTEIIFQSSAMREGPEGGLGQKLAEAEDRILSRINQVGGLAHADDRNVSPTSTGVESSISAPVRNNSARSWAEIRDQFMVDGGVADAPVEPVLQKIDRTPEKSASEEIATATAEQECRLEVPCAVDVEKLNEVDLRTAFYEREAFILTLIGRLRHQHQNSSEHLPAEQLKSMAAHLPEELAAQVFQTLQQLDELARIGELELSLERARLSRQVQQLDHSRRLIEHNARQLGLTLAADGKLSNPEKVILRGSGSRRWLSKLGFGQ